MEKEFVKVNGMEFTKAGKRDPFFEEWESAAG